MGEPNCSSLITEGILYGIYSLTTGRNAMALADFALYECSLSGYMPLIVVFVVFYTHN